MKALVYIAGAYPVERVIRDVAPNKDGVVSPLGFTYTGFVKYEGEMILVCASSENAQVWCDMMIPVKRLRELLSG